MNRPMKTEAIKRFLAHFTHPDLAALYSFDMEVQVNVGQDGGERVEGEYRGRQWSGWTDSASTWKPIRIPLHANTEPEYTDTELNYDLVEHGEGIGMTGWDWVNRCSRWVGFDFDAITGHSERHQGKLTDTQLGEVEANVQDIPWVTVRRSTSGKGLHLYVFVDAVPTANHNEHAALARSILGVVSGLTGYDFQAKVDICGGNMWVWHRKMKGTDGLTILKPGGVFHDIPHNWRDHIKVITGKRRKILPGFVEENNNPDGESQFDELTGQCTKIPLEPEHRRLMEWLHMNGYPSTWTADHHMLITHTHGLAKAHEELELKGTFQTLAQGSTSGDHNCFCFPLRRGSWAIRRYSPGVQESPTWDQDGAGWTRCYFNRDPDLASAARSSEGLEHPSGGFHFRHAEQAQKAALLLGTNLGLPNYLVMRETKLKENRDGKLVAEVKHEASDNPADMKEWIQEGKVWKRVFNAQTSSPVGVEVGNYDDVVRHIVTQNEGEDYGWVLKTDGSWRVEPLKHVQIALKAHGLSGKEAEGVLGGSVNKPWMIVNEPFQPEYPGDRAWNRGAAQFRYTPTADRDNISYPTWMKILNHIGSGLDDAIRGNGWARANGIKSGADYLKCWIASLFQEPNQPLPYLFLYSESQNTGKSILHEALSLLITRGIARADTSLISQSNFNGELENAVLCVVEETDLKRHKVAYNRIKDWVTSREISIHKKGQTPYSIPNRTHWVQCANDQASCPVFDGDTRITMIGVAPLEPSELIPKKAMIPKLEKEAADFLSDMLALELPESNDRLNVPVIVTEEKLRMQEGNKSHLQLFVAEHCHQINGRTISIAEFYARFTEWLEAPYIQDWSKIKVGREMPAHFPKGRLPKNGQWCWGNISWEPRPPGDSILPKLVTRNEFLVTEKEAMAL